MVKRRTLLKTKRIAAVALATCMLVGGSVCVQAATLKDVFDEHYYADQYEDLKEAFGYDREMLWQHFQTYGLKESRNMNGLIDIVKYREEYADLDVAFGDDWDAYLNHYLTIGAKEGRDTGTGFSALDYAERYEDLKEVYGEDIMALWAHYQTYGATENREARSESVVAAEKAAEETAKRQASSSCQIKTDTEQQVSTQIKTGTERIEHENDDGWDIIEWDNGEKKKQTVYNADGSRYSLHEYYNVGDNHCIKSTFYNEEGNEYMVVEEEYGSVGNRVQNVVTYANGQKDITEYDDAGKVKKSTHYNADGSYSITDSTGKITQYDKDGNETSHVTIPEVPAE